jgi:pimeloyl-ACP methyl ester carboxylesterase
MSQATSTAAPLTVVLVHGAFADASSWTGGIERLQKERGQVTAPANPLRGISSDSAYLASVFDQIPGPVLAVGHSYGGAVITNAATNASNVVGLVSVAAPEPRGETYAERCRRASMVQTHLADTSQQRKGLHHESKPALARRETPRSGSITH